MLLEPELVLVAVLATAGLEGLLALELTVQATLTRQLALEGTEIEGCVSCAL